MIRAYLYRGRHRAPSTTGRTASRAATASAIAVALPLVTGPVASASPPGGWGPVVQCESSNRNVEHGGDPGGFSTASGYWQFLDRTWRHYGGVQFAPRAIQASKREQEIVANRAFAARGLADWAESRHCWARRVPGAERGSLVGRVDDADGRLAGRVDDTPAPRAGRHRATEGDTGDAPRRYTVRPNDTLRKIAKHDGPGGVTVASLVAANPAVRDNPHLITPGQRLTLR